MLAHQPIEQIGAINPEIRQGVVVHRHTATQPAIGVMAFAQSLQCACAADPITGGIKPKRQQKPWRYRRMTCDLTEP